MILGELECISRGIHWDTLFAKWCYTQSNPRAFVGPVTPASQGTTIYPGLLRTENTPEGELLNSIWHPKKALAETYLVLALRIPAMEEAVGRAFIAVDHPYHFEKLKVEIYSDSGPLAGCVP